MFRALKKLIKTKIFFMLMLAASASAFLMEADATQKTKDILRVTEMDERCMELSIAKKPFRYHRGKLLRHDATSSQVFCGDGERIGSCFKEKGKVPGVLQMWFSDSVGGDFSVGMEGSIEMLENFRSTLSVEHEYEFCAKIVSANNREYLWILEISDIKLIGK